MTGTDTINASVCQSWTDTDAILECCGSEFGTDANLDQAAAIASDLLYQLSGHRYPGICEATVRPCDGGHTCWTPLTDSWRADGCSCTRLSSITLAGYPVQQIVNVEIDGVTLAPSDYRLDYARELVRMADANGRAQRWPACQRLDLPSGPGTMFVDYTYGIGPPLAGQTAAAQLACEIAKACPGSGIEGECDLPRGTVRMARQGITIDTQALGLWLLGSLRTGMTMVDAFLSVYGAPRHRRTALAVPELGPYPLRVG